MIASQKIDDAQFKFFLVDDRSNDGTSVAVKNAFPFVKIISGNGSLYWNGGMRLAWKTAVLERKFDFYLWINDDVCLYSSALIDLLDSYSSAKKIDGKEAIIVGSFEERSKSKVFSYGGRTDSGPVFPNGKIQKCKYINGNFVLVAKKIFDVVGFLSNKYIHALGDFDYGLRASFSGYSCYISKNYVGTCTKNKELAKWCNPKFSFKQRAINFYEPTGLCFNEYIKYRKKFWPKSWFIYALKAYAKLIFPKLYNNLK
tara:strand:- start:9702 stop:10472 length:771 start_codon:yes stop_codon:yes gene_type:complete